MIKAVKYLSPLHQIATCLIATHHGAAGYGGVPDAALTAVRTYGSNWIHRNPKLSKDAEVREFLRKLVKHSCPVEHTNWSQTWIVFQREASAYAALSQLPPANPKRKR
jgi:hypothetical protein